MTDIVKLLFKPFGILPSAIIILGDIIIAISLGIIVILGE
jgi:hypothetical protein